MKKYEGFKTITGWSVAHCIKQLCAWLDKKGIGADCKLNWEITAQEMLDKYPDSNKNENGDWTESGNGISAYGTDNKDNGYRWRLEINDTEDTMDYQVKVKFYISADVWSKTAA
jgi:hypothetical protein